MVKQITIENVPAYPDLVVFKYPDIPANTEYLVKIIDMMADAINKKDIGLCYSPISLDMESEIEIIFDFEENEYCYGFEYNNNGIEEEWLYHRITEKYVETIFERKKENSAVPDNVPLLSGSKCLEGYFNIVNQALTDIKNMLIAHNDRFFGTEGA